MELEMPIQYVDCEWFRKMPDWRPREDYNICKRVASEIFRPNAFGHNAVRITNSGRYVHRQMNSKLYDKEPVDWLLPTEGTIIVTGGNGALGLVMTMWMLDKAKEQKVSGIKILLVSRSANISDQNM